MLPPPVVVLEVTEPLSPVLAAELVVEPDVVVSESPPAGSSLSEPQPTNTEQPRPMIHLKVEEKRSFAIRGPSINRPLEVIFWLQLGLQAASLQPEVGPANLSTGARGPDAMGAETF